MATPVSRVSVLAVFLTVIVLLEISSTYAQQVFTTPGSCSSLGAVNGLTPQPNANSPYVMQIAPQYYTTGTIITVTVYANQPAGRSLREFIIQARDTATNSLVGTFTRVNGNPLPTNEYNVYNCGTTASTVGTTSNNVKSTPVVFTYQAGPASGNIGFRCSFLQDTGILYQSLASQQVVNQANVAGPVINNCPGDIFLPSSQDTMTSRPFVSVEWTEPTSIGVGVNNPVNPNALIQIGSEAVLLTYTFRSGGSSSTCSFNVVVNDDETTTANTAPVLSGCPVGTVNSFTTPPTCNDAEQGGLAVTCNPPAGSPFQAGTTTAVACSCSDNLGSSDVCTFNVFLANPCSGSPCLNGGTCTVFGDTFQCTCVGGFSGNVCQTPPVDPCTNVVCQNGGTCITNGVIFICVCIPTFSGTFCEVPANPCSGSPCLNGGTCTVFGDTFQCTCVGGFSGNVCQTPANNAPELFGCPVGTVNSFTIPPTCNDAEQGALAVNCNPPAGSTFQAGTTTAVACVCTDNLGSSDVCTFNVFVANPCIGSPCLNGGTCTVFGNTFQCTCVEGFSGNVCQTTANTAPVLSGCPVGTVNSFTTSPTCNDAEQGTLAVTCNPPAGSTFQAGTTTAVACLCSDNLGLSDVCTFSVAANTAPVLSGCPVGTVNSFTTSPTCNDAEQGTLAVTCNPPAGSTFQVGTTTAVTCLCPDNLGLLDVCTFSVAPNTAPVLSGCPVGTVNSFTTSPTCNDAEQGTLAVTCNPPAGSTFQAGTTTTVTCLCSDNLGLSDVCTFSVAPNTAPVLFGCPVGTVNSFTTSPTCNDAEQGTLAVTCNPPAGSTFQAGTTTVVTCFCSDNLGLLDVCTFSVVNSPPQIGPCPTDFRSLALNNQFFLQFTRPSCTDPDGDEVTVTCNPAANSTVDIIPSDVTCTCTDSSQATDSVTCRFDTEPPTIVFCPSDQVVTVLTGSLGGVVDFPTPQAQDNSGFVSVVSNPQFYSGFYFPLGMTTVTYVFSDAVPLTVTCTFTVTVNTASPCDSSPCFNGGVCLAVDNSRFWCVCPGCFIGDTCSFSQDPCTNNNQCLNGGQCRVYPGSCTQTFCECQPCFTGANCQISSNPCDNNQCGNGGVCVPSTTNCDSYTCFCSGCQAGPFCQGVFDPCSRFPCLNGGACTNIAESCTSYSCQCTGCFTGYNCQTVIPDPCVTLPCLNGGICTRVAGTCLGYTCNCQTGFGGVLCENNVAVVSNPCNTFPCMNDGCCVSLGNNNYKCICRNGYTGILCGEITSNVNFNSDSCRNNPCSNGGTCYNSYNSNTNNIVFVPQYTCACPPGFVGQNCQLPVAALPQFDICTSTGVVCLNGGTCRNTYCSATNDLGVFCECPAGFLGERCQIQDVNRCSSSPCRNGGQCTAFSKFFACSCVQGFGGTTCEVTGADNQAPVISNCPTQGVTVTANAGDDFAFVTWPDLIVNDNSGHVNLISSNGAPGNYPVGSRNVRYVYADANGQSVTCSFVVTVNEANFNPCNSSPCQNNAVCSVSGDSFQCTCAGGFTGATCIVPLDLCTNVVCQNGGTCITNGVIFICVCIPTFTGTFCEVPVNNPCSGSPCQNGGTCTAFVNTFQCSCVAGFSGTNCQTPAFNPCNPISPCQNNAFCSVNGNTFRCTCVGGFTGPTCTVPPNPCSGSPCLNGGTCTVFVNTFQCTCVGGFSGNVCQTPNPCIGSPCLNNGVCTVFGNTFQCTCVGGFSGNVCQTPINTSPTFQSCPDVTVNAPPGSGSTDISYTLPFCLDTQDIFLISTCNPPSGTPFPVGSTDVTCVCTDSGLLSTSCTFQVQVNSPNSEPELSGCPVGTVNSFTIPPTCNDAEQGTLAVTCNPPAGSTFQAGTTTTVTCFCSDNLGLLDVCTFSVAANTAPVLSGCPDGTVNSFTTSPTCNDAEQGTLAVTCNPQAGSTFQAGTTTVVTCFCSDNLLFDVCTFSVAPNTAPVLSGCPDGTVNSFTTSPTCNDAEQGTLAVTCNPPAGSTFQAGTTTAVTCFCSDNLGLSDVCTFSVVDTEPPTIVICPSDQVVTVLTGSSGGVVNFPTPQAQDNSGFVVVANNPQFYSGFYFPLGITTVTYEFRDAVRLTVTCTFTVTVNTASPCDSSPCFNGGVCLAVDNSRFWCVCPGCFIGNTCSFSQDPCTNNNQCLNGGQCRVYPGSCTQTFCECQPCFTGANCQISSNPCDNNQCGNGGVCVPSTTNCDSYTCFCSGCQAGPFCQGDFNPCTRFPCLNGGACTNIAESCTSYSCQCIGCFTGYNCQTLIPDPCVTLPCLNGGICTRVAGTCLGYTCNCQTGFGGVLCENNIALVSNPCNTFPCMNDGCCVSLGNNNYKCICRNGYTGILCGEITSNVNFNSDSCRNNPCSNGGTCYNSYNSNTNNIVFVPQYTCACPPGFVGQNCQFPVAVFPQFDICSSTGVNCLNGGTCRNTYCSATNDLGAFCECPAGSLGERCQLQEVNRCLSSPCRNGGQCTAFSKFFVCSCAQGFGGTTCEVTGADNQVPVISNCPTQGVTVTANAGDDFAFVSWPDLIVNDNSGHVNLISSNGAPGNYPVGSRIVRYVYADASGLSATCSFVVTVNQDITPPECDVLTNVTECTSPGGTNVSIALPAPSCSDDSGTGKVRSRDPPSNEFQLGTTLVEYICADDAGNIAQCQLTVTVVQPVRDPCASDPCFNNGSCITTGSTEFVCMCQEGFIGTNCGQVVSHICDTNPCQNGGTCLRINVTEFICFCTLEFTGEVCHQPVANEAPECPDDVYLLTRGGSGDAAVVNWIEPTSVAFALIIRSHAPGDRFPVGDTPVRYMFMSSASGITAECSFTVVHREVDVEPPVLTLCENVSANVTVEGDPVQFTEPTARDTCSTAYLASASHRPGDALPLGSTLVTSTFSDFCGNTVDCVYFVTVELIPPPNPCESRPCQNGGLCEQFGLSFLCECLDPFFGELCNMRDTEPGPGPSFDSCPVGVFTLYGQTNAVVDRIWAPIVATDPSGIPPTLVPIPRDSFIVEMTETFFVEITATNQMQEQAVCVFIVSIIADDIPPSLVCPNDITMTVETDTDTAEVSWDLEVSDDNGMFSLVSSGAQSGDTFGVGTSMISYTATDNALNSASCAFRVIIEVEPLVTDIPRADPMPITCQTGVFTVFTNIPGSQPVVFPTAEALDADGNNLIGVLTTPPTNAFTPGPTPQMITFTFTDSMGLTATCMFQLLLTFDDAEPNIIGCPDDVIPGTLLPGDTMATVTLPMITAIDNSGSTPSLEVVPPGNVFGFGDTSVEYTFSDNAGNTAICSFTVSVNLDPCDPSPCPFGTVCLFDPAAISFIVCTPIGDPCDTLQCFPPSTCTAVDAQAVCLVRCENVICPPSSFCLETDQETFCLDMLSGDALSCMPVCNPGETCQAAVCVQDPVAIIPCVPVCGMGEMCVQGNCVDPCNPDPCLPLEVCTVVGGAADCTDPCVPNPCPGNGVCTPTPPTFQCASPDICSTVTCDPRGTCFEDTPGLAECGVSCQSPDQNCGALGGFCFDTIPDITGICIATSGELLECNPGCNAGETCRAGLCIGDPQVIQQCDPACLSTQVCVNNVCTDPCSPSPCQANEVCSANPPSPTHTCTDPCSPNPCQANEVCSANPPSLTPTCTATQGLCSTLSCEPGTTCIAFTNTIARCIVTCSSPLQNCASLETGAVCRDFSGTAICLSGAGNGLLDCNPPCIDGLEACSGGVCFAYPVEIGK
ncbi:uncharacterized protein [Apostichopus japonicus]|uniref:uncharacterized protein isoform X2 n=1 Tax=Stichopus japonicus TaxID=307972 RepID=UPI003AB818F4